MHEVLRGAPDEVRIPDYRDGPQGAASLSRAHRGSDPRDAPVLSFFVHGLYIAKLSVTRNTCTSRSSWMAMGAGQRAGGCRVRWVMSKAPRRYASPWKPPRAPTSRRSRST